MAYKEVKVIKNNPELKGMAAVIPDVIYSSEQGVDLKMQIITPWKSDVSPVQPAYPLIVFVQGSAWTQPDVYYQLPQLAQFAREGYVVATLTHRNALNGHPFPAFLKDIKAGIRFLRRHAATYQIDPDRVGIWGTSSGGNTALLAGLTGDEERYQTKENAAFSDSVKLVVDCFGPSDLTFALGDMSVLEEDMKKIFEGLRGEDTLENLNNLMDINPIRHIKQGKSYPPFLILHGNADTLVDYSQSELIFHQLSDAGADVSLVCVEGAPHEGSFWSNELLALIKDFIDHNL